MADFEEAERRYRELTDQLRERIDAGRGDVFVFLGAGLSYAVGRTLGRASFESPGGSIDDQRFPSWSGLMDRMRNQLMEASIEAEARQIERFFKYQSELDCAQLFRQRVGESEYVEFLNSQFTTDAGDSEHLTPAHEALTNLPLRLLFTTNYDELIELAYRRWTGEITASATPEDFLRNFAGNAIPHLVKLHGTISAPETIVLTRDDYASSRKDRAEMFVTLGQELRFSTFLFVGFSLMDPTFNIIRDEARLAMGDHMPESFLIQESSSAVVRSYLESMSVRVVDLFSWNNLPQFLRDINPANA